MKKYLFQSQRLGFRTWTDRDIEPFAAMNSDPQVMQFFPNTLTAGQSSKLLKKIRSHFDQHGFGWFAVDTLQAEEFIGSIGLNHPTFQAWFMPCIETGWRLKKEAWNKGYATEGARRCLEYGFDILKFREILSWTSTLNDRSEKVMKKIGMSKIGEFAHPMIDPGHRLSRHVLYRIRSMTYSE